MAASDHETVFTLEATPIKFGPGAADDAGWELKRLGVGRVMLVTDPGVRALGHPDRIKDIIEREGIEVVVYDRARVEPTVDSFQDACDFALEAKVEGFVSVGGGSSIDTAKVSNLITTHPGPVMDYVNPPVGGGRKPPSPLRPHLAIPTTSGTGAEATTVAVLDIPEQHVKSGISHRYLRPSQGIVDPELVRTLPAEVTSSTGLDVICHAAESFISKPFSARSAPDSPGDRPPYQGATPISDIWSAKALEYGGRYLRDAVAGDEEARGWMMLAASLAGIGFGAAGVHIPHALAYPIAGLVRDYVPSGYRTRHAMVPHGMAVILTAPAAFRFTYATAPDRHLRAAALMGAPVEGLDDRERREALPAALIALMRDTGIPNGLSAVGYGERDIAALVEGTLKQPRLLAGAPRPVGAIDLEWILRDSMQYW